MNNKNKPKVIIAALDWGLGHATRMVEVVNFFINKQWQPILASSGEAAEFWRQYFPDLPLVFLPAYNFEYAHKSMVVNAITQMPKLRKVIKQEQIATAEIVTEYFPQLIISDNRYGVFHEDITSVFIGHQLQILPPKSLAFTSSSLLKIHQKLISKFDQIWVPDFEGEDNLSGKLSHNIKGFENVKFIGPLSRFYAPKLVQKKQEGSLPNILALVSGPEPTRTQFEEILISQLKNYSAKVILLQGKPSAPMVKKTGNIQIYNHLSDSELLELIQNIDLIISRSGYSTVMDILRLGKQAVFIPTPEQTEQQYIAEKLNAENKFFMQKQSDFDINEILNEYAKYSGFGDDLRNYNLALSDAFDGLKLFN